MRKRLLKTAAATAVIAAACLAAMPSAARISLNWRGFSNSARAVRAAGGSGVYEADININGAHAVIRVFNFDQNKPDTLRALRQVFRTMPAADNSGPSIYSATLENDKTAIRLFVLQLQQDSSTLLIMIEQDTDDYKASVRPPDGHLLNEIPPYPGSTPAFYAANDDTALQLQSSATKDSGQDVRNFYSAALAGDGWNCPLGATSSMQFFTRDSSICVIMVTPSERQGSNLITLLHKTHGMK